MIGTLIYIILLLIVLGVVIWGIRQLMPLIPLPHPFPTIINVLLTVLTVIVIVYVIAGLLGAVTPIRW